MQAVWQISSEVIVRYLNINVNVARKNSRRTFAKRQNVVLNASTRMALFMKPGDSPILTPVADRLFESRPGRCVKFATPAIEKTRVLSCGQYFRTCKCRRIGVCAWSTCCAKLALGAARKQDRSTFTLFASRPEQMVRGIGQKISLHPLADRGFYTPGGTNWPILECSLSTSAALTCSGAASRRVNAVDMFPIAARFQVPI